MGSLCRKLGKEARKKAAEGMVVVGSSEKEKTRG
jgi:hypothetical protein